MSASWYCSHYLPPVTLIVVANFPPVPLIPVANLPLVSLIPVVHLHLQISPQIFEKNRNDPNIIFRGLGEVDSWKNLKQKSRDTVPLKYKDLYWFCPRPAQCACRPNFFVKFLIFFKNTYLFCMSLDGCDQWKYCVGIDRSDPRAPTILVTGVCRSPVFNYTGLRTTRPAPPPQTILMVVVCQLETSPTHKAAIYGDVRAAVPNNPYSCPVYTSHVPVWRKEALWYNKSTIVLKGSLIRDFRLQFFL